MTNNTITMLARQHPLYVAMLLMTPWLTIYAVLDTMWLLQHSEQLWSLKPWYPHFWIEFKWLDLVFAPFALLREMALWQIAGWLVGGLAWSMIMMWRIKLLTYVLNEQDLMIRSLWFKKKIDLERVCDIRRSVQFYPKEAFFGFTHTHFNVLELTLQKGKKGTEKLFLSPEQAHTFLANLQQRCPASLSATESA